MHALSLLPFLLVTTCFAVPSKRATTSVPLSALPALPASFKKPSSPPVFVALVTGFYNYSCSQNGTFGFSGSSGSAFDISGLSGSAEFTNIQNDAFSDFLNKHDPSDPIDPLFASRIESKYGIKLLGQYSDTEGNNGGFSNPEVDFSSTGGGSVITTVTADAKSPSPTAVDWLEMDSSSGTLASTVLLIETVAGQPPNEDCEPGTPDSTSAFCGQLWGF